MFDNLNALIASKTKEIEGLDLMVSASQLQGGSEKSAGNLTSFLNLRAKPHVNEEMRGAFVSQLLGVSIPDGQEVVRKEMRDLDSHKESPKLQGLKHLLVRFDKLLTGLKTEARSVHTDDPTRGDMVLEFVKGISTPYGKGMEDQLLREIDVVVESFEKDQEAGIPAVTQSEEGNLWKPADRYKTLMHLLNKTQHKYS